MIDTEAPVIEAAVIGIDVGGTKIIGALATTAGDILAELTVPTNPKGGPALVDQIAEIVDRLCEEGGVAPATVCSTVVAGAGAPHPEHGTLLLAPNLGDTAGYDLTSALTARLGHPTLLENDVNAAAVSELAHGRNRPGNNFVFIAVGTGIGMGIVLDGKLLRGSRGAAGEIGFLPFGTDPLDRTNHLRGPLEEAASGGSIADNYAHRTGLDVPTAEVFRRASEGDRDAAEVIDAEARFLAQSIVAVVAILDPERVVLGGGVGSRPELLAPIQNWLARFGHPDVIVQTSRLAERASAIGAVDIAIHAAVSQVRKEHIA
jgi:predicted NBD/HSP70 family sugar kinase